MMKKAYKVVTPDRRSFIVAKGSKFCLRYPKGKTVHTIPDTPGVAVFDTWGNADYFRENKRSLILTVKPIGRGTRLDEIAWINKGNSSRDCTQSIKQFLTNQNYIGRGTPEGTIFYPAVEVLD